MNELDTFFAGGGKALSFGAAGSQEWLGKIRGGEIVSISEPVQQTDMTTSVPLTWPSGQPKLQVLITLDTTKGDHPEQDDQEDDGLRTLYVKSGVQIAIRDALKKAGAVAPEVGGRLYVAFTSETAPKTKGFNPRRNFAAQYTKPVAAQQGEFFGQAPVAAPEPQREPVQAQAPAEQKVFNPFN
jgi:hypothetical protein